MKSLILKRTYFKDATIGHLFIEGQQNPMWFTMEKPWRNNKQEVSCIPEGRYLVEPYSSKRFPDVWELKDVKDRTAILIHTANWEDQLKGCIAVGLSAGYMMRDGENKKSISSSQLALGEIKREVGYPESFYLTIVS